METTQFEVFFLMEFNKNIFLKFVKGKNHNTKTLRKSLVNRKENSTKHFQGVLIMTYNLPPLLRVPDKLQWGSMSLLLYRRCSSSG